MTDPVSKPENGKIDGYQIILQVDVPESDRSNRAFDIPHEYAVVRVRKEYGGCMIYGRYSDRWECNVPARWLVNHLIAENKSLAVIAQEFAGP